MILSRLFVCSGLVLLCLAPTSSAEEPAPSTQPRPWTEYRTIMWTGDSFNRHPDKAAQFFARLREMGINTGMVHNDGNIKPLVDNAFPYYVENMVNRGLCLKFNSKAADWEKLVTDWAKGGRPEEALVRDYCLDDPEWMKWARRQMQDLVRKNAPNKPIAYDIRDELSTTISANPFDYDFGPIALQSFREWLRTQYADLKALNAEWETEFRSWDDVRPVTTDQIKNRMASGKALPRGKPDWGEVQHIRFNLAEARRSPTRWNFAPWADFRSYMDLSLARVLAKLRDAAREVDPQTPVGIEGTQMPHAFGGYDLWRLSQALDWVEPYDIGNAREIFGSFMPGKPLMTTVFETETNKARRRLWHLLLEGDRGCIIWWSEDCVKWNGAEPELTPKAKALKPVMNEMTSDLARLFLLARREHDPVLIHYSQPSIQADWLIESTVDGSTWLRRFSSFESDHNRMAKVRNGWLKAFQDLGFSPRFVSSQQIESGVLQTNCAVLVLPSSYALSHKEQQEINGLMERKGTLFFDGTPGVFDSHGKLRPDGMLDKLMPAGFPNEGASVAGHKTDHLATDVALYPATRLRAAQQLASWIQKTEGVPSPEFRPQLSACARVHRFVTKGARLMAVERNINYQMSEELKQAGGNEPLEKAVLTTVEWGREQHVYDLRSGTYFGKLNKLEFTLDPWQPSLFALLDEKRAPEGLVAGLLKEAR